MNTQPQQEWLRILRRPDDLWNDTRPIRADLFGTERLEHHARSLAATQVVAYRRPPAVKKLSARLRENAAVLLGAYRSSATALRAGQSVTPAAEWLLDNYHLVEQQIRQITDDLPPGFYRQLPKLADGPFAGYPRVLGLAWAYVAHTDSLVSPPILARYRPCLSAGAAADDRRACGRWPSRCGSCWSKTCAAWPCRSSKATVCG